MLSYNILYGVFSLDNKKLHNKLMQIRIIKTINKNSQIK